MTGARLPQFGAREPTMVHRIMQRVSTITCPACGHRAAETMPTDACMFFYLCRGCGTRLKANAGDCCVFCSYGDVPCPPMQEPRAAGGEPGCCG